MIFRHTNFLAVDKAGKASLKRFKELWVVPLRKIIPRTSGGMHLINVPGDGPERTYDLGVIGYYWNDEAFR